MCGTRAFASIDSRECERVHLRVDSSFIRIEFKRTFFSAVVPECAAQHTSTCMHALRSFALPEITTREAQRARDDGHGARRTLRIRQLLRIGLRKINSELRAKGSNAPATPGAINATQNQHVTQRQREGLVHQLLAADDGDEAFAVDEVG